MFPLNQARGRSYSGRGVEGALWGWIRRPLVQKGWCRRKSSDHLACKTILLPNFAGIVAGATSSATVNCVQANCIFFIRECSKFAIFFFWYLPHIVLFKEVLPTYLYKWKLQMI